MVHTPLKAQKPKRKFKKGGVVQLNDSLTSYSQSDIFVFPNTNKIKYYRDEAKLERIKILGPAGDFEEEYAELKAYIKNFGPKIFQGIHNCCGILPGFRKNLDLREKQCCFISLF